MPRKRSSLQSWLGGQILPGSAEEWALSPTRYSFGPDRGGRYKVLNEQNRVTITPIPPVNLLRKLRPLLVRDIEGDQKTERYLAPVTLTPKSLRTSFGLRPRILALLDDAGAQIEFRAKRNVTAESLAFDLEAANQIFARNPALLKCLVEERRGIFRSAGEPARALLFQRILDLYPEAFVGVIVPSNRERETVEEIFDACGRKAKPDAFGELDDSKTLGIVGLPKHFSGAPHRELDIAIHWRAEQLLHRQSQKPILFNRGFPYRAYALLDSGLSLDQQELQQIEFYSGPLIWAGGAVEHGWTRFTFPCRGWPSQRPKTLAAQRKLWTNRVMHDHVIALARALADGSPIDGLRDAKGRSKKLPASPRRRVALACEWAKTAVALAEAAPEFGLEVPDRRRKPAVAERPTILADIELGGRPFEYDAVIAIGISPDDQPLKQLLARAKAVGSDCESPPSFVCLEPASMPPRPEHARRR